MSSIRGDKWVNLDNVAIARYQSQGERFEILVDPNKAYSYKRGADIDLNDILEGPIIFEDVKHGKKASPEKLEKIFGTTDYLKIAAEIIKQGTLQLTTEQRNRMIEEKKKRIVSILAKNCLNPQTKLPHPPQRIERAMDEAKVSIDPWKDAEEQAKQIVKSLQEVIPIRMELTQWSVTIPATFSGKAYNMVSKFGNIIKEEWGPDGSWKGIVEIPAGIQNTFIDSLNKATKGSVIIKKV
ncbi:MAG: ribosome assembly factor SBDS [Candidatus Odinarchaeia archaeon]